MSTLEALFVVFFILGAALTAFYLAAVREYAELIEVVDPDWFACAGHPKAFEIGSSPAIIRGMFDSSLRGSFRRLGAEGKLLRARNLFVASQLCFAALVVVLLIWKL